MYWWWFGPAVTKAEVTGEIEMMRRAGIRLYPHLPPLSDQPGRPEEGIRYYSGAATYRKSFDLPEKVTGRHLFLDLGVVNYVAAVRVNGKDVGVVWTAPWRVEITHVVKPHDNSLEIDVVNLWMNRLIGDAKLPPEKRFTKTNVVPDPDWQLFSSGLLGPVTLQARG